jgi:hypothetical protein
VGQDPPGTVVVELDLWRPSAEEDLYAFIGRAIEALNSGEWRSSGGIDCMSDARMPAAARC